MKKFYDKGGSGGGGRGRFGNRDNRRDDRDRPVMHQATCDECGNECEVPFKPSGGKPVYCKNCFNKGDNNTSRERGGNSYDSRNSDRRMYQTTCDQCGDRCEVPFRPSGDKPVYCNDCFGKNDSRHDGRSAKSSTDYKADFAQLNAKLDEVIKLLGDIIQPKKIVKRMKPVKKEKAEEKADSSEE